MRIACMQGRSRRKPHRTTPRNLGASPAPDLVSRDFAASGPDRLWVADITYIPTWTGFLYLAVVLDAWSCRVIGWAMATHLRTESRPRRAEHGRGAAATDHRDPSLRPGLLVHLDHLSTPLSRGGHPALHGKRRYAYDNALCESFFAALEGELRDRRRFPTQAEVRMAVFDFIEDCYNPTGGFPARKMSRRCVYERWQPVDRPRNQGNSTGTSQVSQPVGAR